VDKSPFSAGTGPVSVQADPNTKFLYVTDNQSNQISEFKISGGSGSLTPNSSPDISTGGNPVGIAIFAGVSTGTADYLYTANSASSSVSAFGLNTTSGGLSLVAGGPVATGGFPSAVAAR
jgi:6-phosphogluconolactonase (cycloisomerase 2 family)